MYCPAPCAHTYNQDAISQPINTYDVPVMRVNRPHIDGILIGTNLFRGQPGHRVDSPYLHRRPSPSEDNVLRLSASPMPGVPYHGSQGPIATLWKNPQFLVRRISGYKSGRRCVCVAKPLLAESAPLRDRDEISQRQTRFVLLNCMYGVRSIREYVSVPGKERSSQQPHARAPLA